MDIKDISDGRAPQEGTARSLSVGKVFAVAIGNALEFYDFLTFSFFAVQIGHTFFPGGKGSHGLLFSLATFGVGFVTRPLGGVIIGGFGDRVGRRPAMVLSFALMGVAITALALIPSYARIGVAAPILLVTCRLIQGFALGGEVGPSTAFLIEAAPPHRRGLYVALQYMTQDLAVLAAGIVGFVLSNLLSPAALDAWGWRLAFLLGALVVPVGLIIRGRLPETRHTPESGQVGSEPRQERAPVRLVILGLAMMAAAAVYLYGLDYVTTYAQDTLHMTAGAAFEATIMIGLFSVIADPLSGLLSDKIGRKPVMLAAATLLMILLVPAFLAMSRLHSVAVVLGVAAILAVLQSFLTAPVLITITESLPKAVRSGVLATLYAAAMALFGGTTQFAIKGLTDATGSGLAPAWYMTGALAVGAVAMLLVRESAPVKARNAARQG
jgi:MHS family citrate/tricarballylate:H+ symporter-like MFS transporter